MAAVLLGAMASVGWRSFEAHRVGRDMAVIASSAAVAAEQGAPAPDLAAPLLPEPEPVPIYTRQPSSEELPRDLPVEVMSMPDAQGREDPDGDLITELRPPAEPGIASQVLPVQPGAAQTIRTMTTRAARGSPEQTAHPRSPSPHAPQAADANRRRAAAPAESPRRICARQERYTDYVCMRKQCKLSRFSSHAQCASLRKTGWWGFIRLP